MSFWIRLICGTAGDPDSCIVPPDLFSLRLSSLRSLLQNVASSRSHTVLTIYLEKRGAVPVTFTPLLGMDTPVSVSDKASAPRVLCSVCWHASR